MKGSVGEVCTIGEETDRRRLDLPGLPPALAAAQHAGAEQGRHRDAAMFQKIPPANDEGGRGGRQ